MALTILTGSSQAAGINYSYRTSGSADWSSVPTASYFYDVTDQIVRYKTVNSEYVTSLTASVAISASYAPATPTFPYTGPALISGSLVVTGSLSIYNQQTGVTTLDTNTYTLRGTNTSSSIDWGGREVYNTAGLRVLSWRTLRTFDGSTTQSIDWGARTLHDNTSTTSVNWQDRALNDASAIKAITWGNRSLTRSSTNTYH